MRLHKFLNVMSLDSSLELFDYKTDKKLLEGQRGTLNLPVELYNVPLVSFIPGIVTKIYVRTDDNV